MLEDNIDFDSNPPVAVNEYDNMVQRAIPGYEVMHTMALSFLRSRLPKKANLLIIGAGTGAELVKFGNSNPEWQFLGLDPSSNMLAIAQDKIQHYGLTQQVQLFTGFTQDLPYTPVYHAATCILVMHFIPDDGSKLALLQSIAQRLESSAPLILVDVFGEKGTPEFEQMVAIMQVYWQEMGMNPQTSLKLLETAYKGVYPIPESRVWELLQQAGFSNMMRFYTGLWVGGWIATKN